MDNKNIKDSIELIDAHLKSEGISRRDAMKLFGAGGAAAMLATGATTTELKASGAKGKIVIIGGGLAGMSTAAKFTRSLDNPDITVIEPGDTSVSYQPGQTFVGSGVWTDADTEYKRDEHVPSGVTLIKEAATEFDPDNNTVTTASGKKVGYDFLVIAAGLKLAFNKIEGLGITETITSRGDDSAVRKVVGKNGISSIYFANGATDTWTNMQKFIADAKSGKKVKGVFTHPNTPIKCGGAPKKIMYLTDARLREAGARANADLAFYPNGGGMFGVKEYHNAIQRQFEQRDMKWNYKHNLVAVDPAKKIATFNAHWKEKGTWDEDLEEYSEVKRSE
ncbi:MAG: FAD-dependent oxidoreductase, partial [Campylobacterota bacterium]|nr:FAD-dependent oxidoreductase [Campylobacterota bacterium]